jgi:hypothetical protein
MAYSGNFKPKHPEKYVGDITKITYRSLWELKCMKFFDSSNGVLKWASEEMAIPYVSPRDGERHKYFPDFIVRILTTQGTEKMVMVEIKPYAQTYPPKPPKRKTKSYYEKAITYEVNCAKWEAAKSVCESKNWEFKILTEKDLYGKTRDV